MGRANRAAWLGFAVFGWGAALVAFAFARHEAVSNEPATVRTIPTQTIPRTPLSDLLDTLYPIVHHAAPAGFVEGAQVQAIRSGVVYARPGAPIRRGLIRGVHDGASRSCPRVRKLGLFRFCVPIREWWLDKAGPRASGHR